MSEVYRWNPSCEEHEGWCACPDTSGEQEASEQRMRQAEERLAEAVLGPRMSHEEMMGIFMGGPVYATVEEALAATTQGDNNMTYGTKDEYEHGNSLAERLYDAVTQYLKREGVRGCSMPTGAWSHIYDICVETATSIIDFEVETERRLVATIQVSQTFTFERSIGEMLVSGEEDAEAKFDEEFDEFALGSWNLDCTDEVRWEE